MITQFAEKLEKFSQDRNRVKTLVQVLTRAQVDAEDHLVDLEEANTLILSTAKLIQQKVHEKISSVVSTCLKAVFDDPYSFEIVFETKAGRTEAKIQFVRNEMGIDPLSGTGGGVVDVAAFALRIAALSLRRPSLRKVLIFDEPFRFVSEEYRPRVRVLIEKLAAEFDIQFIIVTHLQELRCGKVVHLKSLKNSDDVGPSEDP